MSSSIEVLAGALESRFADVLGACTVAAGEVTIEVAPEQLLQVATALRDEDGFCFEQLIDVVGVDYADYGRADWQTSESATSTGFSRGVSRGFRSSDRSQDRRFAVVYHLQSVALNQRLRLRVWLDGEPPRVPSVVEVWSSANWCEREAFDLFGILFEGHPDLRRILTDYGFVGHPFRKDFPVSGHVEMRYDPEKRRVVYEPVSIEPRTLVPRVIREDGGVSGSEDAAGHAEDPADA